MNFTKHHITAKTLCIIDIGSYKLRACAARFKNKKIYLLGYSEKRQDISYFANQECLNLPGLCNNISELIEKLEREIDETVVDMVINYPFGELFLSSKKINYKRKKPHDWISLEEIHSIMQSVEKLCLKKLTEEIEKLYGLTSKEIQIILSRVNSISIDTRNYDRVIWAQGINMKISLLNAFIPLSKYNLIIQIGNVLSKNIYKILPTEYCITKIFSEEDIVVINIWATQTTLSIKKENEVFQISKIPIGIHDLVNKISKKHPHTQAEIIENMNWQLYNEEKTDFFHIWGESFWITLKELLGEEICPKYFYIGWGWWNNTFIKRWLQDFSFSCYDIKMIGDIEFITEDMPEVLKPIEHIKVDDITRIPLDIYVLLIETNHLISRERDSVSNSLKEAIKNLWYIQ